MASGAMSESIFFIGAVVIATGLVGALASTVTEISGGVKGHGDGLVKSLESDIAIINDPENVATSPLVVYAKNTGTTRLQSDLTNVFLDGVVSTSMTYDVLNTADDVFWHNGQVLKVTVNDLAVASGDHRLRVVGETGVGAELEFRKP